jgi:hypothetical protein
MNASYDRIVPVFNDYMLAAIMKCPDDGTGIPKVELTMQFPRWGLVDCLMRLHVSQENVAYIAAALFQQRVENFHGVRFVSLNNGCRLFPDPQMRLKGTSEEAISTVFGPKTCEAIKTCRLRKVESEVGNRFTDCVAMILTCRSDEGAVIDLSLGLEAGAELRGIFFT